TARTSACTGRSRAKPFGLPGQICRPSNEPSIPSAMSITTNGHTKPCGARRPPRCTVAHHASTRPTRHRSSIPATTSSSASPTRGRFASRKSSCLLPTLSSSTRSVSKRSTTGFGLSISAVSYWGALTNATTSSGPRDEVSPMLPVYSVTYLPGCTRSGSIYGPAHAVKVELCGVRAHVPEALLQNCARILFRFDRTEVPRERAVLCADAFELLRV